MNEPSSAPRRRIRSSAQVRRRKLVDAGIQCLQRGGIEGFTIEKIAQTAEVSGGLISYYFDGRDGLLLAIYERLLDGLARLEVRTPATLAESIELVVRTVENNFSPELFSRKNFAVWLVLYAEMQFNAALRGRMLELQSAYIKEFAAYLVALGRFRSISLDADTVSANFIAYLDGLWMQWCLSDQTSTEVQRVAAYQFLETYVGALLEWRNAYAAPPAV